MVCEACGGSNSPDDEGTLIGEYDEIEIAPVKPHVIRHRRFACRCAHCGLIAKAPAPAVATSTPFGPRIHALAIYLKGFQALSYERLRGLFEPPRDCRRLPILRRRSHYEQYDNTQTTPQLFA